MTENLIMSSESIWVLVHFVPTLHLALSLLWRAVRDLKERAQPLVPRGLLTICSYIKISRAAPWLNEESAPLESFNNTLWILSRCKRSIFQRKFCFNSILFSYTFDYFVLVNTFCGWQISEGEIKKENSM